MSVAVTPDVLVAAFVFPGSDAEELIRDAIEGRVDLVASVAALAEFGRLLQERLGWDGPSAAEAVAQVARLSAVTDSPGPSTG